MSTSASAWNGNAAGQRCGRPPKRALEIVGIVFAFIWFWPLAVAYIVWKVMGYPVPKDLREFVERNFAFLSEGSLRPAYGAHAPTGNSHFDEYRRAELERLEAERRRLDEEARDFAAFVEELKRAKDREEFDAYMRRRQAAEPTREA
ncbi:DUF2852 domain-containing protein [Chelatococcus reniformis]|uniref:Membrane protein n=1 Tax=Chelatococcus reniformis TaxID=1494448 RepID=A0A916TZ20_9HYPH|nr:DUF2852 domain-containing protein [Chelatococcus reniformis]GGC52280.1 membrane protein [Chelatococcus reniformis]